MRCPSSTWITHLLEQVGGKAVPQRVRADALADPGSVGRFADGTVELPRRDRVGVAAPGEQPAVRQQDAAPLAFAPPQPQQFEQLRREHGITVLAPFTLLDPKQHPLAVDIVDLEVRDLRHAQARTVSDTEGGAALDARCREQLCHLLDAQHVGQLLGRRASTSRRDRSGRSSVTPNRKRSADTVPLMVDSPTRSSRW